jgi:predicted Zn finger-like uncharacterized protein
MFSVTCPFCNAQFTIDTQQGAAGRVVCPRCGESFTGKPVNANGATAGPTLDELAAFRAARTTSPLSNRTLGLLVLGVMSVMAALGLVFMLLTQETRRAHDAAKPPRYEVIHVPLLGRVFLSAYLAGLAFVIVRGTVAGGAPEHSQPKLRAWRFGLGGALLVLAGVLPFVLQTRPAPQPPEINPVRSIPPGELEGLGYLPADVDAIAAAHVAEAMQNQAGRDVVGKLKLGQSDLAVDAVADWLGVRVDEIDHIVLGLRQVQLFIVVRTRKPYDRERVTAYKKFEVREHHGATEALPLYECELKVIGKLTLKPTFLCADSRTLLLFLNVDPETIARVPLPAPSGSGHLDAPLRELLHEDQGAEAQLWFAARSSAFRSPLGSLLRPVDDARIASRITDLAVWVNFSGTDIDLKTVADCADERTAGTVQDKLAKQAREGELTRDGRRVLWHRTGNVEKLRESLEGMQVKPD